MTQAELESIAAPLRKQYGEDCYYMAMLLDFYGTISKPYGQIADTYFAGLIVFIHPYMQQHGITKDKLLECLQAIQRAKMTIDYIRRVPD